MIARGRWFETAQVRLLTMRELSVSQTVTLHCKTDFTRHPVDGFFAGGFCGFAARAVISVTDAPDIVYIVRVLDSVRLTRTIRQNLP
jgi:hypothetical protein